MKTQESYRKKIFGYIRQYSSLALPGLAVMSVITICRISQPLILREIIDKAVPAGNINLLVTYAFTYLGIVVASAALTYVGNMLVSKLGLSIVTHIKKDMFAHLLTLPVSYFDAHPVGELMSRTENDTEKVRDLFSSLGVTFIVSILTMAGMFAVTFVMAPMLSFIMLGIMVVFLVILLLFFSKLFRYYEKSRSLHARILAKVTEFVQGMEIMKVFNRKRWAISSLEWTGGEKKKNDISVSMLEYAAMSALDSLVGPFFIIALILMYSPKVLAGGMTLGTLLLFFEYGASLLRPVVEIAESIRRMQQSRTSLNRIVGIMELPPEPGRLNRKPAAFAKEIRFDHVWYAYKDEEWVLRDVSFTIPKGSVTAVVGPSGSGKSTTVSLLCGFYQAAKGAVYIDGEPLDSLDIHDWRKKTGLVLQDVYLFPGSVLENVRVYDDGISPEKAEEALGQVHALGMVKKLPDGISTNLWERGGNLSAGEKQLMAFARALAADPELVILDEATSNIDMETEHKIKESMDALLAGRTSLIVAHRLSSILNADQILFFNDGEIIARGTHGELYESLPAYRRLVEQQFLDRGEPA